MISIPTHMESRPFTYKKKKHDCLLRTHVPGMDYGTHAHVIPQARTSDRSGQIYRRNTYSITNKYLPVYVHSHVRGD